MRELHTSHLPELPPEANFTHLLHARIASEYSNNSDYLEVHEAMPSAVATLTPAEILLSATLLDEIGDESSFVQSWMQPDLRSIAVTEAGLITMVIGSIAEIKERLLDEAMAHAIADLLISYEYDLAVERSIEGYQSALSGSSLFTAISVRRQQLQYLNNENSQHMFSEASTRIVNQPRLRIVR